jgi:hypothetical protein
LTEDVVVDMERYKWFDWTPVGVLVAAIAVLPAVSCNALWPPPTSDAPDLALVATVSGSEAEGSEEISPPYFGRTVVAGDLDGDGLDDLVIAATRSGIFPRPKAGDLYVLLGPVVDTDLEETDAALTLRGQIPLREAGRSLALADLTADGHPDIAIASMATSSWEYTGHVYDPEGGTIYVVDSTLRGEHHLEASAFLTITGPPSMGAALYAGDYDGDAVDDLIVGCPLRAEVYVVSGPRSGTLHMPDDADVILYATMGSLGSGLSVGDIDQNDRVELAIADQANSVIYVVPDGLAGRHTIESVAVATIRSNEAQDRLHGGLLGDVNGDGQLELVVTARTGDSEDLGALFVLPGPIEGDLDPRTDNLLCLEPIDRGMGRIAVAVETPGAGETPLLALGLPGRDLFPKSNQSGEVWLLSGELRGRHVLSRGDIGGLGRRVRATETELTWFGTSVLFAETQAPGRRELVVSALFGKRRVSDLGAVLVYELPGEG